MGEVMRRGKAKAGESVDSPSLDSLTGVRREKGEGIERGGG